MGSPDLEYGRQLNGMGGGVSSLSKICVVGPPTTSNTPPTAATNSPDIGAISPHNFSSAHHAKYPSSDDATVDVEYTFVQVGIKDSVVDYSGNCGNLSSMIGVFAVDEGMCVPRISTSAPTDVDGEMARGTVRAWNTNTNKRIDNTFPIEQVEYGSDSISRERASKDGRRWVPVLDMEEASVAGVSGMASQIILDFVNPGGARTGKLLPTGGPLDFLALPSHFQPPTLAFHSNQAVNVKVEVSLIDATNPTVFVSESAVRDTLCQITGSAQSAAASGAESSVIPLDFSSGELMGLLEWIRKAGAERMGLDPSAQAQPKIAIISLPPALDDVDLEVRALSMGVPHKAVPMTVGLCLGVAVRIPGTNAHKAVSEGRRTIKKKGSKLVTLKHPGGTVDVGAEFDESGDVRSAKVVRTGRRLMRGVVWW